MRATAPPARTLLLVEVPGPWGAEPWTSSRLDPAVGRTVRDRADRAGVRPLLVRRPGPHPASGSGSDRAWALVRVEPQATAGVAGAGVRWQHYREDDELLRIDPGALAGAGDGALGPPVALVCTHGRHDVCCAVRGRPVVAALAGVPGWDVWESTHVGGCRFAGNVLALPHGELFGGLDEASAPEVLDELSRGRLVLTAHRGRYGQPALAQAARHHAMRLLGADGVTAVEVGAVSRGPDGAHEVHVTHGTTTYRLRLTLRRAEAARLTCSATGTSQAALHELVAMTRL